MFSAFLSAGVICLSEAMSVVKSSSRRIILNEKGALSAVEVSRPRSDMWIEAVTSFPAWLDPVVVI